jgi:site-specific recombinase XerD
MEKREEYLKQFELKLRCETNSNDTVRNYVPAVRRFLDFCKGKKDKPETLLQNYMVGTLENYAPKSINLHRAAVVKFFEMVLGINLTVRDVPRKRQPKTLPKIIDRETIQGMIEATNNIKHRIEMSLMFGCGLRLSEVAYLRRDNIITTSIPWRLRLDHTKGGRERYVPVPESLRQQLGEFTKSMKPEEFVFKGQGGIGHISKKSLENVVAQAGHRKGENVHPHMLRHSYATCQITSGQNVFKVQQWMGHGSLKSTLPYVHLSEKTLGESTDLLAKENYTNKLGI